MIPNVSMLEGEFGIYRLGVVGSDDFWVWFVSLDDDDLAEGTARTLETAMAAAEVAAGQLAQPCLCCGRKNDAQLPPGPPRSRSIGREGAGLPGFRRTRRAAYGMKHKASRR